MIVHVHDCLVCERTIVLEHVVGRGSCCSEDGSADPRKYSSNRFRGCVREFMKMHCRFFGYDQNMATAEWSYIEEGEHMFIFPNTVAWDFASNDL